MAIDISALYPYSDIGPEPQQEPGPPALADCLWEDALLGPLGQLSEPQAPGPHQCVQLPELPWAQLRLDARAHLPAEFAGALHFLPLEGQLLPAEGRQPDLVLLADPHLLALGLRLRPLDTFYSPLY